MTSRYATVPGGRSTSTTTAAAALASQARGATGPLLLLLGAALALEVHQPGGVHAEDSHVAAELGELFLERHGLVEEHHAMTAVHLRDHLAQVLDLGPHALKLGEHVVLRRLPAAAILVAVGVRRGTGAAVEIQAWHGVIAAELPSLHAGRHAVCA